MRLRLRTFFSLLFLGLLYLTPKAQSSAHLGVSVGGMYLSGGSGFLFDVAKQQPHRETGLAAGLQLFLPLQRDLHLMIGALGQYEKGHFHFGLQSSVYDTEYFRTGYLSIPITLNHMGIHSRKKAKVKEFFGVALNFENRLPVQTGRLVREPSNFETEVQQKWKVNPEFIMGVGIGGKYHSYGMFHWQLGVHIDMFANQIYRVTLFPLSGEAPLEEIREFRGIKAMVSLIYFPRLQIKKKQCYRN